MFKKMSLPNALLINSYSASQTSESLAAYTAMVQQALGASSVSWLIGYRGEFGRKLWHVELLDGWKVMDLIYPQSSEQTGMAELFKQRYLEMARQEKDLSPLTRLALKTVGSHRSLALQQALANDGVDSHWVKEHLLQDYNVADRMLGVFHLGAETESYLLVDRAPHQAGFTQAEQDELLALMTSFPRLHYWLALERGLVAPATRPLSPRQQELVKMVLQGLSEQEMADKLVLSKSTVHGYLIDIYRIFRVTSRTALLRLWLESI